MDKAIDEFFSLAVNRWVGIDAVFQPLANESKDWNTFINSFREKYDASKLPYYERVIQKRVYKPNLLSINYGITTPGIVSFYFTLDLKYF